MDKEKKENEVVYLRLDDILPNQFQPREVFDETGLQELADSIKEHGVIQPVIVRPQGEKYELIAGERRCKASALAGLTKVPAIVREMDDKESAKVSLLENLQRRNLSAIEEARTYKKILELDNMTQDELAKTMGKSQPMIANKIRLLGLPEEVQDALIKNQISERHARSLLNIKNKEQQLMMLDRIRNERLTVRELDGEIKKLVQPIDSSEVLNQDNSNQEERKTEINVGGEDMHQNMINGGMENNFNNNMNQEFNNSNNNFNDNNMNTGMPTNISEHIPQNNQFGNTQNLYGNFSNMGLNDYQGSGMFNNIPNFNNQNMQNTSPIPTFQGGFSNPSTNNSNEEGNSFIGSQPNMSNNVSDNRLNEIPGFNDNPSNVDVPSNKFNSLGSMFDCNPNSNNNQNMAPDYTSDNNSNTFISQIREDTIKPKENQFLPNFDTPSNFNNQNNFNDMSNMNNYDSQNDFGMNNFINQSQNTFNNFNNNNNQANNMNNNDFSNPGLNNFGGPINDFSFPEINNNMPSNMPSNNFNSNQGGLFNQPLNIVSVPSNDMNNNLESNPEENENEGSKESGYFDSENVNQNNSDENNESEKTSDDEEANEKEPFDNPLDDAYEDILNAKPVAVNPEEEEKKETDTNEKDDNKEPDKEESETKEQSEDNDTSEEASEEVEVIGDEPTSEDSETKENSETQDTSKDEVKEEDNNKQDAYIHLEPEKTIFDARGAVYELKKTTDAIKQNHLNIDTEEIEFDDYYQITIKIKKEI